jgi:flagellar biosynthesis/type III secretory pathway protein FliH
MTNRIKEACDKAYKEAGHNAYFSNGFYAGYEQALEDVKYKEMLGMLKRVYNGNHFLYPELGKEIKQLIKESTEL